jgi:hypothetical protein
METEEEGNGRSRIKTGARKHRSNLCVAMMKVRYSSYASDKSVFFGIGLRRLRSATYSGLGTVFLHEGSSFHSADIRELVQTHRGYSISNTKREEPMGHENNVVQDPMLGAPVQAFGPRPYLLALPDS